MQSALAVHSLPSAALQAPPSGSTAALRHVSHASPALVTEPFAQNSVAQAVAHVPPVPHMQPWR